MKKSLAQKKKKRYKTLNWPKYNNHLVSRGDIRLFVSKERLTSWFAPREGKNGRPKTYSNDAILLALTILTLYKLNYRSAEGFIRGLFALMKIALPVPDYTTLCRRMKFLSVEYRRSIEKMRGRPVDLVFDSTGLKVYGRGEWKTKPTHRFNVKNWKMLHLGMTVEGFQIKELELTTCKTSDNQAFAHMLRRMEGKVGKVYGDKAYLATECFNLIDGKGGTAVIDLKPNMKLASAEIVRENPGLEQRNRIWLDIRRYGKSGWKERSGYHRRSLIECQMNRFKGRFGEALFSRKHSHQVTEVKIKAMILNTLSSLGMPMTTAVS